MSKQVNHRRHLVLSHGAFLVLSAFAPLGAAMAEAAETPELQTVTVTAQRRTENIREVPVSVSLIKDEKLEILTSGGQDIRVLAAKVPSLNIESSNGRTFPRFYIRGYGNTDFSTFASQPVSFIVDDVVQENAVLKGYPIFDVAGVEVLRGPQGTLFGRNTPAGVVKIESEKPKLGKTEGYVSASMGTYKTTNVEGAYNVPLSPLWALRFSTLRQHRDYYVGNTYTGNAHELDGYNEHAERVQLLYTPDATFSALFNGHQRLTTGSARLFRANIIKKGTNDFVDGFDPDTIATNGFNFQNLETNGANARLTWNFDSMKLFSISGWEHVVNYNSRGDIDGGNPSGPGFIPFQNESSGGESGLKQLSQEFRLESKQAGPMSWQTGLYYFSEDVNGYSNGYNGTTHALTSVLASHQRNVTTGVFGSLNYNWSDNWIMRGGIRYTTDHKQFNTVSAFNVTQLSPSSADESKNKISWDTSGTYKLNKDINLYARYATGFRAPSIAVANNVFPVTIADSETISSFEAGVKADLFHRRGRVAFSLYDYEIKNQQLTVAGASSILNRLINVEKTKGRGAELDFESFVTSAFKVSLGGSYNFTQIRDPNITVSKCASCTILDPVTASGRVVIDGNPLPQAPKWVANATARYATTLGEGDLVFLTDWSYRSEINYFLDESIEFKGKPLLEGGLRVSYTWDDGKYELAAFGRNITNTRRMTGGIAFVNLTAFINEPRVLGVQFKANF